MIGFGGRAEEEGSKQRAQQGDRELSSFPSLPGEGRGQLGQGVHGVTVLSPYTGVFIHCSQN